MIVAVLMWVIVALIAIFAAVGVALLVSGMREGRQRTAETDAQAEARAVAPERLGLRARYARYIGPIGADSRLIRSPWLRISVEFVIALCGFPGLGWLAGGDVAVGLLLLTVGPAITFGFLPVVLAMTGLLLRGPYVPVMHLPALAVVSAGALTWRELSRARSPRSELVEP